MRRHLRLASSTLPAVGHPLSPAVGPLFSLAVSIAQRVVLNLDHASRRSGPRPLSFGFLSRHHPIFRHIIFTESAGFTQVLVILGAAAAA